MHSPLFESFAIVSENDVFLWIHTDKVVPGLLVHLTPPDCEANRYLVWNFEEFSELIFYVKSILATLK